LPRSAASDIRPNFRLALEFSRQSEGHALPNTHIVEVHFRSPDKDLAATVVNTLEHLQENDIQVPLRFHHAQASDWLSKQLVDLQMKVEPPGKTGSLPREHEILGIDEKQNITTQKLD